MRAYIAGDVEMWLRKYHVDALRLDAVHALVDTSATDILAELAEHTERLSGLLGRPLSLIAESDLNDPRMITPAVVAAMEWTRSGATTSTTQCTSR